MHTSPCLMPFGIQSAGSRPLALWGPVESACVFERGAERCLYLHASRHRSRTRARAARASGRCLLSLDYTPSYFSLESLLVSTHHATRQISGCLRSFPPAQLLPTGISDTSVYSAGPRQVLRWGQATTSHPKHTRSTQRALNTTRARHSAKRYRTRQTNFPACERCSACLLSRCSARFLSQEAFPPIFTNNFTYVIDSPVWAILGANALARARLLTPAMLCNVICTREERG